MSILAKALMSLGLFAIGAWAVESCCGLGCCDGLGCCRKAS